MAPLVAVLVALSAGCGGAEGIHAGQRSLPKLPPAAADAVPPVAAAGSLSAAPAAEVVAPGATSQASTATLRVPAAAAGRPVVATVPAIAPVGQTAGLQAVRRRGEAATSSSTASTVEELLEEGLYQADASPVHLAIRGTADADSVRCAWRGIARTAQQREDAIRFWLRLDETATIPDAAYLEVLFRVVLDALDPEFRETAKANFLAIARGGLSTEYLFLTCYADYSTTAYLLGAGPAKVTVAYDRMDEAPSYELYAREHDTGQFGDQAL